MKSLMRDWEVWAVVVLFLGWPGVALAQQHVEATLTADPSSFVGRCPGVIKFTGRITVSQPGRVQYKFARSDGAFAPIATLNFTAPGSRDVSTTWTIGRDYEGWESIQVVYPQSVESNKAEFKIQCQRAVLPPPGGLRIKEDCVSFNPQTTTVQNVQGRWKIVDGSHWMFDFANNQAEAQKSLGIIKFYNMNQSCFVGRPDPSFKYLLISSNAPQGAASGEDCIAFNPATTTVDHIQGNWKIVDGSHWMFDFGNKANEAKTSLAIIKLHGFTQSCFVGRPDPSFQYLRK